MNGDEVWWLIWSHEHQAWWKPGQHGYTKNRSDAGRYHIKTAIEICVAANTSSARCLSKEKPDETICPDWSTAP